MRTKKNEYGEYVVTEGADRYIETQQAKATSRLLDGSRDHGYYAEYVGTGTIDDLPVIAVYLIDDSDRDTEDEGDINWDLALDNGRIIVDVDALSPDQWAALTDA